MFGQAWKKLAAEGGVTFRKKRVFVGCLGCGLPAFFKGKGYPRGHGTKRCMLHVHGKGGKKRETPLPGGNNAHKWFKSGAYTFLLKDRTKGA